MIYLMADAGPMSDVLEAIARIAEPKNIPILIDAAAEMLTIPNVHLQRGATVVAYSGGKAIRGPQCAGLLLGRKDILQSAWQASAPHHGPGRDNKVGREETLGMLAAVEAWVKRDHPAEWKTWLGWLDTISKRVAAIDGVKTAVREPTDLSNQSPSLAITWDAAALNVTGEEVAEELATTKPRIAFGAGRAAAARRRLRRPDDGITVTAWQMQPGDDKVVAERLHARCRGNARRESRPCRAPAADVAGRWDVDIEFFSSRSQHTLLIEQDGNWLQGSHQGDFSDPRAGRHDRREHGDDAQRGSAPGQFDHVHLRWDAGERHDLRAHPPGRVPDRQVHGEAPHVHDYAHTHSRAERAAAGDVRGRAR